MGAFSKIINVFRRERLQQDAEDELAWHLEQRTLENMSHGMNADEARAAARRRLGNQTKSSEEIADADRVAWLETLVRDVRISLRSLRKTPLFAAITVLSLALGIGANTVVFTVMKHVIMDSLPVPNAAQLVILHSIGIQEGHTYGDGMVSSFSYPQYRDLDAATGSVFSGVLARMGAAVTLERRASSQRAACELVSGNYFSVLGVRPWRGRLLTESDNQTPNGHPVAVLSYALWARSFAGDSSVLGQTIKINSHPYVIVGVTPPNFYGVQMDSPRDIFVPMMMKAQITPTWDGLMERSDHWAALIGRLKPGVSMARAQTLLAAVYPRIRDQDLALMKSPGQDFLREFKRTHVELSPGGKGYAEIRSTLDRPLRFLGVMVGIVLLITIVNIANLLIARSAAREREMAVRLSVGAGKAALVRQVLTESVMLAAVGGVTGIVFALLGTPALLRLLSTDMSQSSISARPDGPILLLMSCATLICGFAFGLLPALQSARADLAGALKSEGSTGHTAQRLWLRRTLVGAQIGLSMLLLTGAMLFTKSLRNIQHINPGFETDRLITFKVDPSGAGYSQARMQVFAEEALSRLASVPGVSGVTSASNALLEDDEWGSDVTVEGSPAKGLKDAHVLKNQVSPSFFQVLRLPLRAGRTLDDHDLHRQVAVVNATFAKHFLNGGDPVGHHFQFGSTDKPTYTWTIVGMVADSQSEQLRSQVRPFVYLPYFTGGEISGLTFYVRASGAEKPVMEQVRATLRNIDSALPIYDLKTVDELINNQLFAERGLAVLSILFAVLAVTLAIVGLYGVIAYSVTRRQREFGIRMAIGATPRDVLTMVLGETAWIGGLSLLCALPFVFLGGRAIQSALYGVQSADPAVWSVAALLLFAVALLSGVIPATRGARIDPHVALRSE